MVRLRLKRTGRRHRPAYRIIAVDQRASRDGRAIEELGLYDPANENPDLRVSLNSERIAYWLSVGAQPSETVRSLIQKAEIQPAATE
jgi:small subunit ribosomal protein S16